MPYRPENEVDVEVDVTRQGKQHLVGDEVLPGQTEESSQAGRRKFLKGAIATTPILLAVTSRPVWARNCSLSGQLSGNLSNQDDTPCGGEGCTPGFWKNHHSHWHPDIQPHRNFDELFGCKAFGNASLHDVCSGKAEPSSKCGHHSGDYDSHDKSSSSSHDKSSSYDGFYGKNKKMSSSSYSGSSYGSSSSSGGSHSGYHNVLIACGRHAVAALQNAATGVKYDLTVAQVIESFNVSYGKCDKHELEMTKNAFEHFNEQGCPHGSNSSYSS